MANGDFQKGTSRGSRGHFTGITACCSSSAGCSAGGSRRSPQLAQEFTFPVPSGWIAGESLMGVALML